jgi:hypothetical protein
LMANKFLPETEAIFGRPSRVASHRLYVVDPAPPSERLKDPDGTVLLESRSTGCQTVFPPSAHSGEGVLWVKNGSPSKQQGPELLARVRRLAAASLLARHWPSAGSRQEAALALAGALLRLRWGAKEAGDFITAVAQAAGDEEWKMRFNTAEFTERRLERDLPATAWKRLETLLDPAAVRQARAWLEADKRPIQENSPGADHRELDAEIKTQAEQLLKLADAVALFHTPDDEGYATVPINGHKENLLIRSSGFRDWLLFVFYKTFGKPPSTEAFKNAIGVLDARARYEGPTAPVFLRIAHLDQDIYIDLCNSDWEVVRVTAIGWTILTESPVCFYRARGMAPLPRPAAGASIGGLRQYINAQDEKSWRLIVAWLLAALFPTGPYPILILQGEAGTAKSTTARILRSLVDPSISPSRAAPRDERDLMIAARNSWVLNYDNLSGLSDSLSDAFCRLSTGGGLSTRKLYTDMEETIFEATRPIILNGIDDLARREDLADRALIVAMSPIPEDHRCSEAELQRGFQADAPQILGGLLDVMCGALRNTETVDVQRLPRMADFVQKVAAAEHALGWPSGSFLEIYGEGRTNAAAEWLEADSVAKALVDLLDQYDEWNGTATELLLLLNTRVRDDVRLTRNWPKDSRTLGGRVRRALPSLRKFGIQAEFDREARTRRKLIGFKKVPLSTVPDGPELRFIESEPQRAPSPVGVSTQSRNVRVCAR